MQSNRIPPRPARDCGRPAQAATHTHQPPSSNSQKSTKSAVSHPASPYAVVMPHRSPYGPYSHTISLTRRSPRPARALADLQSVHGGSSRQLTLYPPRPATGSRGSTLQPTHSNSNDWGHGHGIASRCDDGVCVDDADDRGAQHLQSGLKTGQIVELSGLGARLQSSLKA